MLERKKNVMLRLTEPEERRLREAWSTSHPDAWRRVPFAEWCRRTILNLFPPTMAAHIKPKRAKRKAA